MIIFILVNLWTLIQGIILVYKLIKPFNVKHYSLNNVLGETDFFYTAVTKTLNFFGSSVLFFTLSFFFFFIFTILRILLKALIFIVDDVDSLVSQHKSKDFVTISVTFWLVLNMYIHGLAE